MNPQQYFIDVQNVILNGEKDKNIYLYINITIFIFLIKYNLYKYFNFLWVVSNFFNF